MRRLGWEDKERMGAKVPKGLGGNGANLLGKGLKTGRRVSEHEGWGRAIEQGEENLGCITLHLFQAGDRTI